MKNKATMYMLMISIISICVLSSVNAGNFISDRTNSVFSQQSVATITGDDVACQDVQDISYKTADNMDSYEWEISDGGFITYGLGTNSILVTWKIPGDQWVTVKYRNPLDGEIYLGDMNVTVNANPTPAIAGADQICLSDDLTAYQTEPDMNNYLWEVSSGGTIISGENTEHILVKWATTGLHSVFVTYTTHEGCKATEATEFKVSVEIAPTSNLIIQGTPVVCAGSTQVNYYVDPDPTIEDYFWSLPNGSIISGGIGTNSILVDFAPIARSGDVTVYGQNLCGVGPLSTPYVVTVDPQPSAAGTVTGPEQVCKGQSVVTYAVPTISAATSYNWTIPAGAQITGGANTNTIEVTYTTTSASGYVTVNGENHCGEGVPSNQLTVSVNDIPEPPVVTLEGSMLTSSSTAGNQWFLDGEAIPGATRQQYLVTENGKYYSTVTLLGCTSDPSNPVDVVLTKVNNLESGNVQVYPNPCNGQFTIKFNGTDLTGTRIQVYNNLGVVIYEKNITVKDGNSTYTVDLGNVPTGTYAAVIQGDKIHITKNILVK